jgi:hypothetical protein
MDRRKFIVGATVSSLLVTVGTRPVAAQDEIPITEFFESLTEVPSSGARRPGPVSRYSSVARSNAIPPAVPIAIRIPNAAVDASVERLDIVDGVMPNPSGPWVISWYHDLGTLGRRDNVVMAGHVDYWDVGPAVFWNLSQLVAGDTIEVISESERGFTYALEWAKNYVVADMTPEDLEEMLGDAGGEALTLITCAIGSWDATMQEYRDRTVLRATLI